MFCPYCGATLPDGERICRSCAQPLSAVLPLHYWLHLTQREAAVGVRKQITLSDGVAPVFLSLPAGTADGAVVTCPNVRVMRNGVQATVPLMVHIIINTPPKKNQKISRAVIAAILILALVLRGTPLALRYLLRQQRGVLPARAITAAQAQDAALSIIPHFDRRAYLQQLSPTLLGNFTALYESVSMFETRCSLRYPMETADVDALAMLLYLECPELIQLDFSAEEVYSYSIDSEGYATIRFHYGMEAAEYAKAYAECDAVVQLLCGEMAGMTDYEKELFAYDYITANCTYRMEGAHVGTAYGTLVNHAAKCDGISLAMKWVMEETGVSCLCITGREVGEKVGHAWNIIELDGQYYDLDLTADVTNDANPVIMHCAVNVSSHFLRDTLVPDAIFDDYVTAPGTPSMAASYHVLNGSYFAAGEDVSERIDVLLAQAHERGAPLCLQFEAEADYRSFLKYSAELLDDWAERELGYYLNWDGWYSADYHTFCFVFK